MATTTTTWKRSFVATTVALGGTVDEALDYLADDAQSDASTTQLVAGLRGTQRAGRAAALATAVRDIVFAVDTVSLR